MKMKVDSRLADAISKLNDWTKEFGMYIQGDITDFAIFDLDTDKLIAGEIEYSKFREQYIYDDMEVYK